MDIKLFRSNTKPLYKQIADYYRELIERGFIEEGTPLPSQRDLADKLGVNRSTISTAYSELWSSGYISSKQGSGTKVINPKNSYQDIINWQSYRNSRCKNTSPKKITNKKLKEALDDSSLINLATGDLSIDLLSRDGLFPQNNQNRDNLGFQKFLDKMFNIKVNPDNLLFTGGYLQSIYLIISTFLNKGDIVLIEKPSILYNYEIFKEAGVETIPLLMDDEGLIPDYIEHVIQKYNVKMLFTHPTFQNPIGSLMPLDRRKKLIDICKKTKIPIIETISSTPLYHYENSLPSLYDLADDKSLIISIGCFEELLGHDFKTSWLIGTNSSIEPLAARKHDLGLKVSPIEVQIIKNLIRQGDIYHYIERLRNQLNLRKELMVDQIKNNARNPIEISIPRGGKDLWCYIDPTLVNDLDDFFDKCITNGVVFMPGSLLGEDHSYFKLSFARENLSDITQGVFQLIESLP